ncbi:DUF6053 domain-containing protein [Lysobacter enzymogenes]|uniref:DUF6053 domain-containing protein n=1 Tax=Lysobacter enzymogenes TaxID=69 RepID=UPI003CCD6F4B
MGGPSGPMPFGQVAASRDKGIGPEGPPTKALPQKYGPPPQTAKPSRPPRPRLTR